MQHLPFLQENAHGDTLLAELTSKLIPLIRRSLQPFRSFGVCIASLGLSVLLQPRLMMVLAPGSGFSPRPGSEPLEDDVGPQCLLRGLQLLSWDVAIKIGSQAGFLQRINTLSAVLEPALLLPGFVRGD